MKYKVQNNTSYTDTPKTFWISVDDGTNSYPVHPQEIAYVSDDQYDIIQSRYPGYFTTFGTDIDPLSPVQYKPVLSTTWELIDLGRYCTKIQIQTAVNCQISFSGWSGAPTGNPPTQYIIDIPASGATPGSDIWEYDNQMNPFRQIYARASTGSVTPTIIAN